MGRLYPTDEGWKRYGEILPYHYRTHNVKGPLKDRLLYLIGRFPGSPSYGPWACTLDDDLCKLSVDELVEEGLVEDR